MTSEDMAHIINEAYEKKKSIAEFVKEYLIDIVVIIVILGYMARALATISGSGKTVVEIIADSALAFFFAMSIAKLMQKKGLIVAEKDPEFIGTVNDYKAELQLITPYIENLDSFCHLKTEELKERELVRVLRYYGLSIDSFNAGFGANPTEKQKQALKAVNDLKIHELTSQELVSEGGKPNNKTEKGGFSQSEKEYIRKKSLVDILTTAISSVIFGYFTLKLIEDFSLAALIWAFVQVTFFSVKGALSYTSAYMFKKSDYRNRIIQKIALLQEFYNLEQKKQSTVIQKPVLHLNAGQQNKEENLNA